MAARPIALIIGAGPNVGLSCAKAFNANGYEVLVSSRTARNDGDLQKYPHFTTDLSRPSSVVDLFNEVKKTTGVPSVVIYNAATASPVDGSDPLSTSPKTLSIDTFERSTAVNVTSVLVAAQQAVLGFKSLPETASRTFIYTGNTLNVVPMPALLDLGMGKAASGQLMMSAAAAYKTHGFKFYYGDQRQPDGGPSFKLDGDAHAAHYLQLAQQTRQEHWLQTFVKDKGHVDFSWQSKP